ncbi:MAG: hypothetical protein KKF44_08110, partial [Nanoarchaeota archaeon]|nr:hypothetical protein [Nanoarchaeota archaeon]
MDADTVKNPDEIKYKRNKEKRKNPLFLILAIILILPLFFITTGYRFKTTRYADFSEEVPIRSLVNVTKEITKKQEICQDFIYDYYREWRGITNFGKFSIPSIYIQNQENRWGEFGVNFSFFDEEKYEYDLYKGREYADFKDELSRDMADMQSENIREWIGPGEAKVISATVIKRNPGSVYWALASIDPPEFYDCREEMVIRNFTEEEFKVRYEKISGRKKIIEYKTITEMILDLDILVIVMLFVIILILLYLNYKKYFGRKKEKDGP